MLANIITAVRILCALPILFSPAFSGEFAFFYLLGGVSDALDGPVARKLGQSSAFGAKLDTAADFLFDLSVIIRILTAVTIPGWLLVWTGVIALIKLINIASGLLMNHRFPSVHSLLNKTVGVLLFALPLLIGAIRDFTHQALLLPVCFVCVLATFAAIVEGHLIRTGRDIRE